MRCQISTCGALHRMVIRPYIIADYLILAKYWQIIWVPLAFWKIFEICYYSSRDSRANIKPKFTSHIARSTVKWTFDEYMSPPITLVQLIKICIYLFIYLFIHAREKQIDFTDDFWKVQWNLNDWKIEHTFYMKCVI